MLPKILAWASLACTLLFAILAVVLIVYWKDLQDSAVTLVWFGALPLVSVAILLALALLVASALTPRS
ncbi:MAG: hypothetical protein DWI03_02140 [Planctomycetota bacterium]|jgi:hypothetical protein|nr:MAG: hypothetical protein DWI03_02140 [Planctomycetota bacterium]